MDKKLPRCPNGQRRNPKTKECEKIKALNKNSKCKACMMVGKGRRPKHECIRNENGKLIKKINKKESNISYKRPPSINIATPTRSQRKPCMACVKYEKGFLNPKTRICEIEKHKSQMKSMISRKTIKKKAIDKILGFKKMKLEKKKFEKLMKDVNAAQQRRKSKLKKIIVRDDQFTSYVLLHPTNIVEKIRPISIDETGSGSSVGSIFTYDYGVMVCKLTPYYGNGPDAGWHETELYSLINNLINFNISPFVLKAFVRNKFTKKSNPNIDKDMVNLFALEE